MKKKIWFKRKSYGWGWTPASTEGWLVLFFYVLGLILIFRSIDIESHSGSDTLISFAKPFIVLSTILIIICYWTGEKPKWTWGKDIGDK